jgi:1,4-alpha-glucan branching enzyme
MAALVIGFAAGALTMFLLRPAPDSSALPEAVSVTFMLVADSATEVTLVGDFNNWNPQGTQLRRRGGVWSAVVQLTPGSYNYAFLIDGRRWLPDPNAPLSAAEDFGRPSSVLFVSRRL